MIFTFCEFIMLAKSFILLILFAKIDIYSI